MAHFTISEAALGDKLKQASRALGLDTTKSAIRHAAQGVLMALQPHLTPFFVTGGLTFDPRLRETDDADIVAIRRVSNREMQNAFSCIAPRLALQGINITGVSREPHEMPLEYGDPVQRWRIQAMTGGIRTNFDLDVGHANGALAKTTEPTVRQSIPSIAKGLPPFNAYMQPKSTSAAQKVLALLMQPASDLRAKDLADVVNGDLWPDDLNCATVAREIARVCAQRGIPLSVCAQDPEAFRFPVLARLEPSWNADRNAQRMGVTFLQAWTDLCGLWTDVHEDLVNNVRRDVRRRDSSPLSWTASSPTPLRPFQHTSRSEEPSAGP